ncbi:TetR/AcrR family transcriptional regulator [Chloroflexota bacterium]
MQQRSIETRSRILAASMKHFAKHGFKETSIQQICQDAGVSKGAFYHHFASKQSLFMDLLKKWLNSIDVEFASAQQDSVPESLMQMTELLPTIINSAGDQLPMFLEFWLQASRDKEVWEASISPYRHYQGIFEELIQRGIEEGSFTRIDPKPAAQMIVSVAVGLLLQGLLDPHHTDWSKTSKESMQIIIRGLEA